MSTMEGDDGGIGEGTAQRPSPRVDKHTPNHPTTFLSIGGVVVSAGLMDSA